MRAPLAKMQKEYFVYADAANCKCLYAGNQENYQRYQSLSVKQNIAEMNEAENICATSSCYKIMPIK